MSRYSFLIVRLSQTNGYSAQLAIRIADDTASYREFTGAQISLSMKADNITPKTYILFRQPGS